MPRPKPRRFALAVAVLASLIVVPSTTTHAAAAAAARPKILATYYLWWSVEHWKSLLGPRYPVNAATLPLPATLGADGCHPVSRYAGNHLTDVPARLYSQDAQGQILSDVRQAASAGLSGFIVNWAGAGTANQTASSSPYSRRLRLLVAAVHRVRAAGTPFTLWLSYKASASRRTPAQITDDLGYFTRAYARDPAFDHIGGRVTVIWQGSRKYPTATLATVFSRFWPKLRILGDESTWSATRARYLNGDAYYWSSQNPYTNPQSFAQLAALARAVRNGPRNGNGTVKTWIASMTPGFDSRLAGGSSCVPRNNGRTMRIVFDGNLRTHPEAWDLISWNEVAEATYIDPMTRYGRRELTTVHSIVTTGH